MNWVFAVASLEVAVAGRIATLHMTEGEAMVAGWPYWLTAVALAAVSVAGEWRESVK